MKLTHVLGLVVLGGVAALAVIGWSRFNAPEPQAMVVERTAFIPPAMGVPADRVGAGTRGVSADPVGLDLLVPAGGGLTTLATPILVWKLERPFDGDIQVLLGPPSGPPTYSTRITGPFQPGYVGLDLNGSGAVLEQGRIYAWTVRLIGKGSVQTIAEKAQLIERVARPEGMLSPAQSGLWYDALHPFVAVDGSGRVDLVDAARLSALLDSAGLGG